MLAFLLVAIPLAMDALAVSIASGICIADLKFRDALRASLFFGLFQFLMPILGWYLGGTFRSSVDKYGTWVAFALLAFIGIKMIIEGFRVKPIEACADDEKPKNDIRNLKTLLMLSVATSLDALAVGISYSILRLPMLIPAIVIGIVTFILSLAGAEFGKRIGSRFERWAMLISGIALVGIGAKMLI